MPTPLPTDGLMTGTFSGTDWDYIDLGVTGGLQLWEIEATGEGISRLSLYDGGGETLATTTTLGRTPTVRLLHLLLPPGHNLLRLEGTDGTWLLRARPLGPPVDGQEYEPNDDETRALPLRVGQPQTGWLDAQDDRDFYSFHLAAAQRVSITLDAPADLPMQISLGWGDASNRIAQPGTVGAPGDPQRLVWEALLPPGDFALSVSSSSGTSREPYVLTLDLPSFFDRPVDLEPNDEAWRAAPLAPGALLAGVLQGNDTDWFALDPSLPAGPLQVRLAASGGYLGLRLAQGDPEDLTTIDDFYLYQPGDTATLHVPSGGRLFLRVTGAEGPYALDIGDPRAAPPPAVEARLTFDQVPVAAYEPVAQRLAGILIAHNLAKATLTLRTAAWVGDERWRVDGLPEEIVIGPGAAVELPVTLEIAADARDDTPVYVDVALSDGTSPAAMTHTLVPVETGVPPDQSPPVRPAAAFAAGRYQRCLERARRSRGRPLHDWPVRRRRRHRRGASVGRCGPGRCAGRPTPDPHCRCHSPAPAGRIAAGAARRLCH